MTAILVLVGMMWIFFKWWHVWVGLIGLAFWERRKRKRTPQRLGANDAKANPKMFADTVTDWGNSC